MLRKFATYYRQVHVLFLVGIYAAFFSVQLFFNFDANNYRQQTGCAVQKSIQQPDTNKKQTVVYKKHTGDCKNKAWLNKRFEPNEFTFVAPETLTVPYFTTPKALLEELVNHKFQKVKDWARSMLEYTEKTIKRERLDDEEYYLT